MPRTWMHFHTLLHCVGATVVCVCGCSDGPRMAPVSGAISVDGKPLVEAGVTFTPDMGGRPAWATTDKQGRYQLTTLRGGDGALVGDHVVTIAERGFDVPQIPKGVDADTASVLAEMPTSPRRSDPRGAIDPSFASRSSSTLRYTVKPGVSNVADFDLSAQGSP